MAGPAKYPDFVSIGPGTPTGEFLRRFWQPVFESAKLPNGRSRSLRILGEDFSSEAPAELAWFFLRALGVFG